MSKIYSPGDGRVLSVGREGPGDITTIRVFLSIFDVHVQRMPCSGRVDRVWRQPGAFRAAMKEEARLNERNIVRIVPEGARGPVIVEQIAGYVARRIECWVREGDEAGAGQRYGIIYFGSQVALHLSGRVAPLVRSGDRVVGGVTEVAKWTV
ncbi:MAG: phosphatidylserine decarboxylase [Elusimicrobia bacterium]|nr:phosphatidylserine decarboxylase [Elusimicrobiota bacterium]